MHGKLQDAQLAVKRDVDGSVLVTLEHMKDGAEGDVMRLRLKVVEVGVDDYGKQITSCVIDAPAPAERRAKAAKLPPAQKIALAALHEAIIKAGKEPPPTDHIPHGKECVTEDLWRRYCYAGGISRGDTQDAKRKA